LKIYICHNILTCNECTSKIEEKATPKQLALVLHIFQMEVL
jgi:hypothetical protein